MGRSTGKGHFASDWSHYVNVMSALPQKRHVKLTTTIPDSFACV